MDTYDTHSEEPRRTHLEEPRRATVGRSRGLLVALGLASLALIVVLGMLLGLFGAEVRDEERAAVAPGTQSLGDITEAPGDFQGRMVTVVGEIDETHADGSFTLGEYGALGDEVLVVPSQGQERLADLEDEIVRVTGKVQILDAESGGRIPGLAPEIVDEWAGKPVVIAQSVTTTRPVN